MVKTQRKESGFWLEHVAAFNRQLISASEYAKRHGIAVKRLYYWQRKLRTNTAKVPVRASQAKAFVAVRVAEPVVEQRPFSCTLVLESGMRLEMSMLPAPAWLAALEHAVQGAR